MFIFDLDDTLVDTSKIKKFRRVDWDKCIACISTDTHLNISLKTLDKLRSKHKIAIVTNSPKFYAENVLNFHNVKVDELISYRDTIKHKPYPEPMLLAAKKMGVNPKNCIAIGDNINDVLASNNAGMNSIAVTWGEHSLEKFDRIEYWKIFSEKKELEDFILSFV